MRARILAYIFTLASLWSVFVLPVHAAIIFSVSNPQVNSDEVIVDVSITGTSTSYYLQGLFTESGKTNYFGLTQNHYGDWFTSDATPNPNYITTNFYKTTPTNDSWSGQIKVRNDLENPNYKGPGEYTLKIRRYTGNSSNSAEEKVLTISFASASPTTIPTPSSTNAPSPTPDATSTPKPTPTPKPAATNTASPTPTKMPTPSNAAKKTDETESQETPGSDLTELVLGESSDTPTPTPTEQPVKKQNRFPLILSIAGLGLILGTSGILAYKYYKPGKINQ